MHVSDLPEAWAQASQPSPPVAPLAGAFTIELPHSKVIVRLHYEAEGRSLVVEFRNGTAYRYFGVSRDDYSKLATSASPGARFNQDIQPYHECERLA